MKYEDFVKKYFIRATLFMVALLAADVLILTFGVLKLERKAESLSVKVANGEKDLKKLRDKVEEKEKEVGVFNEGKAVIDTLKNDIFMKRSERFIPFQKEMQRIIETAGMVNEGFDYKYSLFPKDAENEGWKDGFVQVSMSLPLEGSYPQIKKLISLFEDSGHFIIVRDIDISKTTQGAAMMNFKVAVSTFFVYDPSEDVIEVKK